MVEHQELPEERRSLTHEFSIAGHKGYITVGLYEDGKPGEIFLVMAREGSAISGLMNALATSISMALQYGVPLEVLVEKFSNVRFEPSGFTQNLEISYAKSVVDYIFRWLALTFLSAEKAKQPDNPLCDHCGTNMANINNTYQCSNCGWGETLKKE